MNLTLLPTAIRQFIARHQTAAITTVFGALAMLWGFMLWGAPQREVQAAPYHPMPGDSTLPALSDSLRNDSLHVLPDSLRNDSLHTLTHADSVRIDSIKRVPRDSTARIEQFHYKRPESVTALPVQPRGYSMFLKQPTLVQTEASLDSTGRFVIIRQTVGGKDVRVPVRMPLDEYIAQRFKAGITQNFEELVLKNEEAKKRDDLGELLTSFTNIDIPIPANPVFSIFGPPRINLHISGAVDIRAAFRNTTTDQVTTSALGNSRNEPDFAQEVQINVSGTIGDKLNINADWNTQRQFEYENQLKIKYTGYEDEIVQSVEAGNVSLPTNSKFISSSSALFGIKAQFQLGPLKLTAVASQKKGQVQEKTVTGGSSEVPFEKKAYDYSKDHFFIDTLYRYIYEWQFEQIPRTDARMMITDYEVWITNQSSDQTLARKANAYIHLDSTNGDPSAYDAQRKPVGVATPGEVEEGQWIKLEDEKDYRIDRAYGTITMNRSTEGLAVAIAYRVGDVAAGTDRFYGTMTSREKNSTNDTSATLVLKLIKPKSLLPQFKAAWRGQMKNIYPLGGRNIKKEGFSLDIVYRQNQGEPTPKIEGTNILQILGLDKYSEGGGTTPDGKFDYSPGITIDEERGEIIFPSLEPFNEGLKQGFQRYSVPVSPDSFIYKQVYDTTVFAAQNYQIRDRFLITGKTTAGMSNTINLGFNIVEGSVQVLLNNQALTPNVDYTVDYIIGQVIIKNQAALVPGANLSVKFEQNDLFQLASKTLLGLRGDLNLSDRTQLGFTMMSLDQQTLSDKVRLGEEPMKNAIYGIDGKTGADLDLLTKAIDALPFISTKEKSDISVFGEAAYMSPDPNTKKSPIPIDNGQSIAYVDDFEGAKRTIPLGVTYGLWHDASPPAYNPYVDTDIKTPVADELKIFQKGRMYWYNMPTSVRISDIYGDKKTVAKGQEWLTVMTLHYDPRNRGAYNYSDHLANNFGSAASPDSVKRNWAGIQRVLSSSALDLVRENINFIELWVKVDSGRVDTTRKIFIDLGAINEDVLVNRKLDTEDKDALKNGILAEDEDTGIDQLTDEQERAKYADFINRNSLFPELSGDPSGDNWYYNT
ncbi:MAG: cell surface protein SprA, partial [Acidobacteriota bacterium]